MITDRFELCQDAFKAAEQAARDAESLRCNIQKLYTASIYFECINQDLKRLSDRCAGWLVELNKMEVASYLAITARKDIQKTWEEITK